jgi:ribosomal protein S18 acetylase RimI-like enzyme
MTMHIRRLGPGDDQVVHDAAHLFDHAPQPGATQRVLEDPTHHLLVAQDDRGQPVGFVSAVEITHPDKGTDMFVNELGVDAKVRGRGIGGQLVDAILDVARECGCRGAWVLTEEDNAAALGTYRSRGGERGDGGVMFSWSFAD